MSGELERHVTNLKQGEHLCPIYESEAEQMATLVPFIKAGIARGERCLYVADERNVEGFVRAIAAAGVDVAYECERGALGLLTDREVYLRSGDFNAEATVDFLRRAEAQTLAEGFSGLCMAGEMAWAMGPDVGCNRLIEYEVLLNEFVVNSRSVVLCLYNRPRFDPASIHDALRSHPLVILGDQVCPNPYYEPPELLLGQESPASSEFRAKRVDWWIAQLRRARAAEQERERVLEELEQSERRLAEAQKVAHIGSWERDLRTDQITWTDELYRLFGLHPQQINISYQRFLDLLLPQDADRIRTLAEETIRERRRFKCDYRITLPDGSIRVLDEWGSVILNEEGEPIRLVGTAQDVTELRQAEQARQEYTTRLQALSHRLLDVQESERRNLARELHDEVGQLLTGLRLLLKWEGNWPADEVKTRSEQARNIVDELLERIRALSFDLRPAALDQLGLLAALLALFERFTGQTGLRVDLQHEALADIHFEPEVETTAYRIVQEALTNVARHAGVSRATVRVWVTADSLSVQIEDEGCGFDPDAALTRPRSIGLAGMQERAMLLGGHLTIESRPGTGTQLTAELPLGGPVGRDSDDHIHRASG